MLNNKNYAIMTNERKQLEIISNQLSKAMDIVIAQKHRYEKLQSQLHGYNWTCEEDGRDNEIAIGLMASMGGIEEAYENIYNE